MSALRATGNIHPLEHGKPTPGSSKEGNPDSSLRQEEIAVQHFHQTPHGQHEFPAQFQFRFIIGKIHRLRHEVAVTAAQRNFLTRVAKLPDQPENFVGMAAGFGDSTAGFANSEVARLNLIERGAIKRAASLRARFVDAAEAVDEARARLVEGFRAALRVQLQAERGKAFGVILRLQLHVAEEDAVAAEAAVRTKLVYCAQDFLRTNLNSLSPPDLPSLK